MARDVESIQRTFAKAIDSETFERLGPRRGVWDISGTCTDPKPVTWASRATGSLKRIRLKKAVAGIELVMLTKCRRCPTCLEQHARFWRGRAITECQGAERTWFGSFTCRPEQHVWIDATCSMRKQNFELLPQEQKFAEQSRVLGIEATKFLKRVREASGFRFRYLLVTEVHDGEDTSDFMRGRPHLHMLLHEFPDQPIRKAMLEHQWKWGNTTWRICHNSGAAWYICKYISKASDARVRASLGYGDLIQTEQSVVDQSNLRP